MRCNLSVSPVQGNLQARILEWVALLSSRGIFPTQWSNLCLPHWEVGSLLLAPLGNLRPKDSQEAQGLLTMVREVVKLGWKEILSLFLLTSNENLVLIYPLMWLHGRSHSRIRILIVLWTTIQNYTPFCITSKSLYISQNIISTGNVCQTYCSSATSLVVPWLRLHAPKEGDPGLLPGQGTRSHMLQLRVYMSQLKILHASTKDPTHQNEGPMQPNK